MRIVVICGAKSGITGSSNSPKTTKRNKKCNILTSNRTGTLRELPEVCWLANGCQVPVPYSFIARILRLSPIFLQNKQKIHQNLTTNAIILRKIVPTSRHVKAQSRSYRRSCDKWWKQTSMGKRHLHISSRPFRLKMSPQCRCFSVWVDPRPSQ